MANKIRVLNLFNACSTWPEMFIKITKFIIHLEKKSADPALTVLHFCFFKCVYFEKLFNVRH